MKLNKTLTWITLAHLLINYIIYYGVVHHDFNIPEEQLSSQGQPYLYVFAFGIPLIIVWFLVLVTVLSLAIVKAKDWFSRQKVWITILLLLICIFSPIVYWYAFLIALNTSA